MQRNPWSRSSKLVKNSETGEEREASVGSSLLRSNEVFCVLKEDEDLNESLKGSTPKVKGQSQQGEVKVIKLTSQGHMAAPNWLLQKLDTLP